MRSMLKITGQIYNITSFKMSTVSESKAALRKLIKDKVLSLSNDEVTRQSDIVAEKLFNLPIFKNSQRVSIYLSTDHEVSTIPIMKKIFEMQKKCYVPRYSGNKMEMVILKSIEDYDSLPLTKWNIKQPSVKEQRENALESGGLELIISPGVAFTKDGHRCGHGKGYYDTFFNSIKQDKAPVKIGLAFKEQIVDSLPVTDHDVVLDMVLYPDN